MLLLKIIFGIVSICCIIGLGVIAYESLTGKAKWSKEYEDEPRRTETTAD